MPETLIEGIDFKIEFDEIGTARTTVLTDKCRKIMVEFENKQDYFGFYDLYVPDFLERQIASTKNK